MLITGAPGLGYLALVADFTQEIVPPRNVIMPFDAFRRRAVNHAQHSLALVRASDNDFDSIGGRTEYRTHLGHVANGIQDIDRVSSRKDEHKGMSTGQCLSILYGGLLKRLIIPVEPCQTCPGTFIEGQAELGLGRCCGDCFIQVFHGLDEMRLTNNDVGIGRKFHANRLDLEHSWASARGYRIILTCPSCCADGPSTSWLYAYQSTNMPKEGNKRYES